MEGKAKPHPQIFSRDGTRCLGNHYEIEIVIHEQEVVNQTI